MKSDEINVTETIDQNETGGAICKFCLERELDMDREILFTKVWMIWDISMVLVDFGSDLYVVFDYYWNKDALSDAIILLCVFFIAQLMQAYESKMAKHPLFVWFGCGQLYEAARSFGCTLPTLKWEHFRYIQVVTEAIPQCVVQTAIIIKNTRDHNFEQIPIASTASVCFTIFSLAFALTERACMPPNQYHRKYLTEVLMARPCSQESRLRLSLLVFFFSDTLLRVLAFGEFINVKQFQPWNFVAIAFIFPIYVWNQWSDEHSSFKQTLMQSFVSFFANDALLHIESGNTKQIVMRLRQMTMNVFVILAFLCPVFFHSADGEHTSILIYISSAALFVNIFFLIPSVYYKFYRNELNKLWELQKGHACECPAIERDDEI